MSKPKKRWWNYVRRVLYDFPVMDPEKEADKKEYEAVLSALQEWPTCSDTYRLVDAVFFKKTHTISGAAMKVLLSERTARRRVNAFIESVGKNLGF